MATNAKKQNLILSANANGLHRSAFFTWLLALALAAVMTPIRAGAAGVQIDPPTTTNGYLARLLINEVPFPGEHSYVSETDTKGAMLQILWVLHSRIHIIPAGYQQKHVAGVRSKDIIDIITGTGGRRQCAGFYRDDAGKFVTDGRVEDRLNRLLGIAGSGKPGTFASLLNYGQGLATAYVNGGIEGVDRYAGIKFVGTVKVTGRAYSWMTDMDNYHPGGNFVTIPPSDEGTLGGNRFFTLRKIPK